MAEIRRLENEDIIQFNKIQTIAFNMRKDYSKVDGNDLDPLDHPANWACGSFDGKKLLAAMYEIDFLMRFDGHSVKMTGIGGVATLPEARKGGHIRRVFEEILPQSYERGFVFSCLTPFSHDFYRKFGYEIACPRNKISISTGDLSVLKADGQFTQIFPGDDTADLEKVHNAYIANINHGICRDYWPEKRGWKRFTNENPYTSGSFLYLWKDETGAARSYIKYQDAYEDGDHVMQVKELAFIDKKGLYGALSIAGGLSAQYRNLKWAMPTFIDPCDFIGDAWSVEMFIDPKDMTRVVNVKTALELMRRPYCDGEYVIEIEDKNIKANEGKYLVEFSASDKGEQNSRVTKTDKNADISCDIHTATQLITGYRTLENALYSRQKGLEVHSNVEVLKRVFTQRPQHITEYF